MKIYWILPAALVAALTVATTTPADPAPQGRVVNAGSPDAVPGQYIVGLDGKADVRSLARRYGADVGYVYSSALHGFSAHMSADEASRLAANPSVKFVQQSVRIHSTTIRAQGVQNPVPSWGLAQIDGAADGVYKYPNAGAGVHVYNTDSHLNIQHRSFEGRASSGWDFVDNDPNVDDCQDQVQGPHGTHTAGTSSSEAYGVAKNDRIVGLKVLNCVGVGDDADAIEAIDWVTANAVHPAVANASWGATTPLLGVEEAMRNSIDSGVSWVVAAGNDNIDACNFSPARLPRAITVAATRKDHAEANYSNHGSCVDVYAPGTNIVSAVPWDNTSSIAMTGTSMAAPHVTGAAAIYLHAHPAATPAAVVNAITANARKGYVTNLGPGSPNLFLNVTNLG